jgi:hypothetical protein
VRVWTAARRWVSRAYRQRVSRIRLVSITGCGGRIARIVDDAETGARIVPVVSR